MVDFKEDIDAEEDDDELEEDVVIFFFLSAKVVKKLVKLIIHLLEALQQQNQFNFYKISEIEIWWKPKGTQKTDDKKIIHTWKKCQTKAKYCTQISTEYYNSEGSRENSTYLIIRSGLRWSVLEFIVLGSFKEFSGILFFDVLISGFVAFLQLL